jgi:hypothetical protein
VPLQAHALLFSGDSPWNKSYVAYFLSLALLMALYAYWWRTHGVRFAIGATTLASLVAPTWLIVHLFGLPLDITITSAVVCLLTVCFKGSVFFRRGILPYGFVNADLCLIALVGIHCISDWIAGGSLVIVPFRAYGEWLVPYFLGRFCVMETADLRRLAAVATGVLVIIALFSVAEALLRVNLFESLVGERPLDLAPRDSERFGLKRAYGPTKHSMYLGVLILLLLPWLSLRWLLPNGWLNKCSVAFAASVSSVALLMTGSRMAMLGTASALAVASFCFFARFRWLIAVAFVVILTATWWFSDPLIEYAMRLSGESRSLIYHTIEIDGQKLPYSSAMCRIHILRLYRPALEQAGLFGYGTERTEGFPIRVPIGKGNEEALRMMPAVDNAYLLIALRFGWLGVSALIAAMASFILNAFIAALHIRAQAERAFACSLCGSLLGAALVCATVWMPHDFGFLLLWTGGVATSLRYAIDRKSVPAAAPV